MRRICVFLALVCIFGASHSYAGAQGPPELKRYITLTQNGGYVAAGVGVEFSGRGNISITGVPASGTVTHAFLYWATLYTTEAPDFWEVSFANTTVAGHLIGTGDSLCWSEDGRAYSYRADVTSLVRGNGTYQLRGFPYDPAGYPWTDGASLVVVYSDAGAPKRDIVIYDGAAPVGAVYGETETTLAVAPMGTTGGVSTTYVVGSGSFQDDHTTFNGQILASDTQTSSASFDGSDGESWDTDTYDVTSRVTPGASSITAGIRGPSGPGDCVMHVAQVLSYASPHGRSLTFTLSKHLTGAGQVVVTDGFASCQSGVTVQIQKKTSSGWKSVKSAVTDSVGVFSTKLPDRPGRYRAVAAASEVASSEGGADICVAATSAIKRHRH